MSNHLRHCPKHRKPLPCVHCAAAQPIIQPVTIPGFVPEGSSIAQVNKETDKKEIEKNHAELDRQAERSRNYRKFKREKLEAIKKALRTPIAEIKAVAEARDKAIKNPGSMSQGKFLTDAPTSKGRLENVGNLDLVSAARSRSVVLGCSTIDHETGEAFWPDNDRRHVKPEGVGDGDNEKAPVGRVIGSELPVARTKFKVRLGDDSGRERAIQELIREYVEECVEGDGLIRSLCRLCQAFVKSPGDHIETVHGSENEPTHDARFGDIVSARIRRIERKEAKLQKTVRDKALEITADAKAHAEIGAIQTGYVKLNGRWIPNPSTA